MDCWICKRPMTGRYYIDSYGHTICSSHIEDGEAVQCFSCGAFMLDNNDCQPADGRKLCPSCLAQRVSTSSQTATIKRQVLYWLTDADIDFEDIKINEVPIFIVSAEEIAGLRHTPVSLANKGVTIIQSVNNLFGIATGRRAKKSYKIYILDNLIKPEFAATLAHELMHIWQHEHNVQLAPPECEGLCNLGAWFVYNRFANYSVPHLKKAMMENPDSIYGDGFRKIYNLYEKLGIEQLLSQAKTNRL